MIGWFQQSIYFSGRYLNKISFATFYVMENYIMIPFFLLLSFNF